MKNYKTTIGLEIHAELKTNSKMFCPCKNDPYHGEPNEYVCPICMGHPGTLPVINKEAIKSVLRVGVALGGKIADFTEFDRKNYFYPDIPKGYQISQYKYPLIKGGELSGIKITRIHLEEDTGTSIHKDNYSLLDYNRAGVPLMELVTEPVIHSASRAGNFARELQLLLRYLGVSDANMEKGEMRVEANISVADDGDTQTYTNSTPVPEQGSVRGAAQTGAEKKRKLGTKVEVKNLNSFKVVEKAIEYETKRHVELLEKGEKIIQETRGWDDSKQKTYSQRAKEESHDYRYFPEPDLPKLVLSDIKEFSLEALKEGQPELPLEKMKRFAEEFKLKNSDIDIYINNQALAKFFESAVSEARVKKLKTESFSLISNYILSDIVGLLKKDCGESYEAGLAKLKINPENLIALVQMINEGKVSSRGAKDILALMYKDGGMPEKIAEEKNLIQKSDPETLRKIVETIISENPKVVEEYKKGKDASLQFLVGQGMKLSKGSANPSVLAELFKKLI